jgi:hypothetical protein
MLQAIPHCDILICHTSLASLWGTHYSARLLYLTLGAFGIKEWEERIVNDVAHRRHKKLQKSDLYSATGC